MKARFGKSDRLFERLSIRCALSFVLSVVACCHEIHAFRPTFLHCQFWWA